jgi:integrase
MRQVNKLASGRYQVRFRFGENRAGTGVRETSESFPTKREAVRFAQLLDALGPQGAIDQWYEEQQQAKVPTLDEVAADHIEHLTGIEAGTRLNYGRLWARTWGKHIGAVQAHRVTRDVVARAVNELAMAYSHKSLQNQRGLLSAVLDRAVEHGHLKTNPAKGIRLPRGNEADRAEMCILTDDEFADVEARIAAHYRPLVRFMYGTGCRWGEAVALTVADVRLPNVTFRRALKWSPDGQRYVGATKTEKSNRTIALPEEIHAELRALCAGRKRGDLVFTAPRGGAVLHRTFWSRVWLPAVGGLEPRPRIHDLRHTHASQLLAAGVPIHIVQARLGHSSIGVTVNIYGHLLPDAQKMAAEAASLAFRRRPPEIES